MTLTLDPATLSGWPQGKTGCYEHGDWLDISEDGRPWSYIFCSDELPKFCRLLFETSVNDDSVLRKTVLYLDINPAIGNGQATEIDSHQAGLSRIGRLLNPLHQLHSFGAAQIDGPLSGSYKEGIIASICKDCPTAVDIIHSTIVSLNQADEQASKGQLLQANQGYKAALNSIRSCCWRYDEWDFVLDSGPFPGLEAEQIIHNISVRLVARIAAVYLESGKLRMARIYTERALDPRRPYDDRQNKVYSLSIETWESVVYAEVLHVAAKISYAHGDVKEAKEDLETAGQLVPFDEEQESRHKSWQDHANRLQQRNAKRRGARELQSQKRDEKTAGTENSDQISTPEQTRLTLLFTEMFLVACNWKNKGDRLLRSGRSDWAVSKYLVALGKINLIGQYRALDFQIKSEIIEAYCARDAVNALRFKVQACVAAAFLMSRKYKDVGESTDAALECSHASAGCTHQKYDACSQSYCCLDHDWWEDQKLDYARIHYCKALALKHLGDTVLAIEHMEKALDFDPGDNTVFAQLVLLKRRLEEDVAREHRREK